MIVIAVYMDERGLSTFFIAHPHTKDLRQFQSGSISQMNVYDIQFKVYGGPSWT
jgi:hypothetical protein